MLVLKPLGVRQVGYYLPGAEPGGHWAGTGCRLLGLDGAVDASGLGAALAGRGPDGTRLVRPTSRRRGGFDAILAAPKSVSLLAALSDSEIRDRVQQAHDQAVRTAFSYLERHATWTRRRDERIATDGLTAAWFSHDWSAAGDPHLHTHLVVANLVRGADGMWSTLDSRSLYRHARAAGAMFQASLRDALADRAMRFDWIVRPSGLADIAGVPRSAIEACSRRQAQVAAEASSGSAGRRGRATAAGRTRARAAYDDNERWDVRAQLSGFDRATAASIVDGAARAARPSTPAQAQAPARSAVETVLAERTSRFERPHVIHALAGLATAGAGGPVLERWADDFLTSAIALDRRTWTTPRLRQQEQHITSLAARPAPPPAGMARVRIVEDVLAERSYLTDAGRDAVRRLTTGGAPVELLGAASLIGQSWVLDAARAAWDASGHRVAALSQSDRGAARWLALAGLGPPPPAPAHATVLIVDGADRWSTAALHQVMADGEARNAKVVLIDGGTTPAKRRPASPAFEDLRSRMPAIDCGSRAPDPSRLPDAGPVVRGGLDRSVAVAASGPAAMVQLVADWAEARAGPADSGHPTMVAMGPEEAEYLNALARFRLEAAGRLGGPVIEAGGRHYRAGDEVRALDRDSRLGSVPGGTAGVVTTADPGRQRLVVQWPDAEVVLTGPQPAALPLTHAYATTPAFLRGNSAPSGPVLALGDPRSVARGLTPDVIVQVLTPVPIRDRSDPTPHPGDPEVAGAAWRRSALALAAETRPTRAVESVLGRPPASADERRAWRSAAEAIEAYRNRWSLPDKPLDLTARAQPAPQLADALGVAASVRALQTARGHDRGLTPA